uniref:Cell cycle checkpoint protein RAD1 n=2 Tax=Ascaris suum TaxID=6253 RepID=F1LDQ1_ASCSU
MMFDGNGEMQSGQQHVMELKMENAREVHPIVRALMFREHATIDVTNNGLRVIVDDQSCLQAIAYVKSDLFSSFIVREPSVTFGIPIAILTECLSVFGTGANTALKMTYSGYGEPLKVMLEKDGIVVKCVIRTQNPDVVLDFDFDASKIPIKVIMKPQKLKEAFHEFDSSSSTVTVKVNRRMLCLSTEGDLGKIKTEFPQHSEQIERLECKEEVEYSYRLCLIKRLTPSLNLCQKVSLRIDYRGILSVQFMIEQSDNNHIFIEFFCVPDADIYGGNENSQES